MLPIKIEPQLENNNQFNQYQKTPDKRAKISKNLQQSTKDKPKRIAYKKFKKMVWTKQEDQLLRSKVIEKGPSHWAEIAQYLPNRSGKQCRERWHNHLRQGVTKKAWEMHQYWMLALCVRAFGRKWSAISQFIPGRSDNTIKNQWNCKMKPFKKLLRNTDTWANYNQDQQILLKIIQRKNKDQSSLNNQVVKQFLDTYCMLLNQGHKQFQQLKKAIQISLYSSLFNQNIQQQESQEPPGDLSAPISGESCIFYDSEQEDAIFPKNRYNMH